MQSKFIALALLLAAAACFGTSSAAVLQCPACTLSQCAAVGCGKTDPYACLSGTANGGCAATPWGNISCSSCCNSVNCSSMPRFQCNATCSAAMCQAKQRCSVLTPYMCTSGADEYGCSTSKAYWPTMAKCDSCCDVTSCEETCGPCTEDQCQNEPCTTTSPYLCTAGPQKNGCSNSSTYWGTTSQCYSCCDTANCAAKRFNCSAPCPTSVCHSQARCSTTQPYMCIAGNATDGCSAQSDYWPANPSCTSCCDVTTCEFTCPACTASQCAQNTCNPWNPYTCTSGPMQGGCSSMPNYFGQQTGCYACCDASNCPTNPPVSA